MTLYTWIDSPLGRILLTMDGEKLTGLHFEREKYFPRLGEDWLESPHAPLLARAARQVREYFAGERDRFDLPLAPAGTPFQQRVWRALLGIGCGETATYGEIARRIGAPRSVRAVGAAIGRNPISIVVPCHRVVGSTGALTGYAGGLERKRALLAREHAPDLVS
ncbi:MAG: methylated-DNA--[protein]-cysteine S-methyltransferase [Burkholderiales bacterium]|nr:methylated-DNA--[protein]-cysteine S-methyltransferase [Burkholderiales bacterium]